MKKWLESPWGKALGVAVSCLAAAGLVVSLLWMRSVSYVEPTDLLLDEGEESFLKSGTFRNLLRGEIARELNFYGEAQALGGSGELNREALVDILEFDNRGKITGKDVNGLSYSLGDLLEWKSKWEKSDGLSRKRIIVCQNYEDEIYYYYVSDLRKRIESGELVMAWENEEDKREIQQVLDAWENIDDIEYTNRLYDEYVYEIPSVVYPDRIVDKDGNVLYSSFWLYEGSQVDESYKPQGADSLLEIVNEKRWSLEEIFSALERTIDGIAGQMESFESYKYEHAQDSNVRYLYVDLEEERAFSNKQEWGEYKDWKSNLEKSRQMGSYAILTKNVQEIGYDSIMSGSQESWEHCVESALADTVLGGGSYVFAVAIDTDFPVQDWLYEARESFQRNTDILKKAIGGGVVSAVLFLSSFIWLTLAAGRGRKEGQVALNFFDRWKTEVAAILVMIVWGCLLSFFLETGILGSSMFSEYLNGGSVTESQVQFYVFAVATLIMAADLFFLWGYLSLVRRMKAKTLWKNSILRKALHIVKSTFWLKGKEAFFSLKDIPRKAAALAGFLCIQTFLVLCLGNFSYGGGFLFFLLFLTQAAGIGWIVKVAVEYQKIQKGVKRIAAGDIAWQIPEQGLSFDRKTLVRDINHIGEGLDKAVDESLRSERLKTELITNVSHDIKTPLTSIINYVDLLQREQFADEKIQGYLNILEKKSQQLKTLTEDVVEASKASTGNLKLEYEDLNLVEMILQVNGEFQEKFGQQDLELIQRLPERPVIIWADGRRVWRILENIYQNVYKYAMPHTRVYLELEAQSMQAVFTMKNISQEPLNISPDELTERFIRGDSARNTQGSGLGLSIAKSLTQLQAGEFKLHLDGDLFKVWIAFPIQKEKGK
ncbi:MAG: HAMP domain-containing histidine kinase [Lachnospiraceae bacterium]|nr:HAMP domain-containing histidine kinase [Lachnospiraceae bacterium]